MLTERLQHIIDVVKNLPPEEQDRVAAAMQAVLEHPPVTSDAVRPDIIDAFERVMNHSTDVLDYLRDK
jgi:hypothetical protein